MAYELQFLFALVLTIGTETLALLFLARFLFARKGGAGPLIAASFFASSLTLPYFWFLLPFFLRDFLPYVLLGEGTIILVEVLFYRGYVKCSWKEAATYGVICNLFSILCGEAMKITGIL